mmetsp:Transcript_34327/g.91784  ORF Transcript_34327/g.91784 Transcript_34327/m.91784 type:complete len:85 (+) Transcript_34327:169-423(+)
MDGGAATVVCDTKLCQSAWPDLQQTSRPRLPATAVQRRNHPMPVNFQMGDSLRKSQKRFENEDQQTNSGQKVRAKKARSSNDYA